MTKEDSRMLKKEMLENENISRLGTSENILTVKKVSRQLEQTGFHLNIDQKELETILYEGFVCVKERLVADKTCTLVSLIEAEGVLKFFDRMYKGKKDVDAQNKAQLLQDKKLETLLQKKQKIQKKSADTTEIDLAIDMLSYPEKYINDSIKELKAYKTGELVLTECEVTQKEEELKTRIKQRGKLNIQTANCEFSMLLEYDLREYIGGLLFDKTKGYANSLERYIRDYYGDVIIDFEHILLLYYYLKSINHPSTLKIEGVLYYKAIETFYMETRQLLDGATKGVLKPSFDIGADTFAWKRFPQYTRKYMLKMLRPEGYVNWYIEVPNIAQLGYLIATEITHVTYTELIGAFKTAKEVLQNQNMGIFYKYLTKEQENLLIPYILTEHYPPWVLDGEYTAYLKEKMELRKNKGYAMDMYNRCVKPYSLDIIGSIIYNNLGNLERLVDKGMVYIYYVSPQRIGISVREDITDQGMQEIFGETLGMLKKVETHITVKDLAEGLWL